MNTTPGYRSADVEDDRGAAVHVPALATLLYAHPATWSRFFAASVLLRYARAVDQRELLTTDEWLPSADDLVANAPAPGSQAWIAWGNAKQSPAETTRLRGYLAKAARALDAAAVPLSAVQPLDQASNDDLRLVASALATERGEAEAPAVDDPPVTMPTPTPAPAPGRPRLPPQTPIPLPGTLPRLPSLPGPVPPLPAATSSSSTSSTSGAGLAIAVIVIAFILGRRK